MRLQTGADPGPPGSPGGRARPHACGKLRIVKLALRET